MKIKATLTFTFECEEQSIFELKEYLKQSKGFECLEWISENSNPEFNFSEIV